MTKLTIINDVLKTVALLLTGTGVLFYLGTKKGSGASLVSAIILSFLR